jgi:hypothetical protein
MVDERPTSAGLGRWETVVRAVIRADLQGRR